MKFKHYIILLLVLTVLMALSAADVFAEDDHIPLLQNGELVTVHFRPAGRENYTPAEEALIESIESAFIEAEASDGTIGAETISADISSAGYTDPQALIEFLTEYLNSAASIPIGLTGDISLDFAEDGTITGISFANDTSDMLQLQGSVTLPTTPVQITTEEEGVQLALAQLEPGMTDLEKALILHDYIVLTCDYDYENYLNDTIPAVSYTSYGVFVNQTAVCAGYARAYAELMSRCGIDCYYVSSSVMNHGWNMIKIDGEWYHVDCTWDDPVGDLSVNKGYVKHTNFLRGDSEMEHNLDHYGWSSPVTADKSGAYVGYCFRPVADVSLTNGGPLIRCFTYIDGWYYTLVTDSEYQQYYGGSYVTNSLALKTDFSGEHRSFYDLGGNYQFLFGLNGMLYAGGVRDYYALGSEIRQFTPDFSSREDIYISRYSIINFRAAFGVLWVLENDDDPQEEILDTSKTCIRVEEGKAELIYDPADGTGSLVHYSSDAESIIIPVSVKGYPVTEVRGSWLSTMGQARSITFPEGVTKISIDNVSSGIRTVTLPSSCTEITKESLNYFYSLSGFVVDPDNPVFSAVDGQLCDASGTVLIMPAGGGCKFYRIPSGVKTIENYYSSAMKAEILAVPASLTELKDTFFSPYLKKICYEGTQQQWEKILKKVNNYDLSDVEILFNTDNIVVISGVMNIASPEELVYWEIDLNGTMTLSPAGGAAELISPSYSEKSSVKNMVFEEGIKTASTMYINGFTDVVQVSLPASLTSFNCGRYHDMSILEAINVAEGSASFSSADGVLYSADGSILYWVPAAKAGKYSVPEGVKNIETFAFNYCSISALALPASLQRVGTSAFLSCSYLETIDVDTQCKNFKSVDGVLYSKDGRTLQAYPAKHGEYFEIPEGVISMASSLFVDHNSLNRLVFPASFTGSITPSYFIGCDKMEWFGVSEGNPNYVSQDGAVFSSDMEKLYLYPIANARKSYAIPEGVKTVYNVSFSYAAKLESLTVPSSVSYFDLAYFSPACINTIKLCASRDTASGPVTETAETTLKNRNIALEYDALYPDSLRLGEVRLVFSEDGRDVTASIDPTVQNGYAVMKSAEGQFAGMVTISSNSEQFFTKPEGCTMELFVTDKEHTPLYDGIKR